jgi:cysteinyl-tRNA synthetase
MALRVPEVTEKFMKAYLDDVHALGCMDATHRPRVTEHMNDIITFIEALIQKGYAYEEKGDVFFNTKSFDEYGKLSQQSLDDLQFGIRIQVDERKKNPLDFVLWKAAKPGEIHWKSPWGEGRPGWHIECSVLAKQYLGDTLDLHAGGQDLIFPHHENEIAQSEALNQTTFARYWMHNGFINFDNEKMSKSLGNFVLLHELREKYAPKIIRFFLLSVHYRNPINFNEEIMEQAREGLLRIENAYQNSLFRREMSADLVQDGGEWIPKIEAIAHDFDAAMDDDFNTANAITALFELARLANYYVIEKASSIGTLDRLIATFQEKTEILGISLTGQVQLDNHVELLLQEREEARRNRNFDRSDQIRTQLKQMNIVLEDTSQGTRWKIES